MLANWGQRHFRPLRTFWGTTVLFINAKLNIGNRIERLNCIAQKIAECDSWFEVPQPEQYQSSEVCSWMNLLPETLPPTFQISTTRLALYGESRLCLAQWLPMWTRIFLGTTARSDAKIDEERQLVSKWQNATFLVKDAITTANINEN